MADESRDESARVTIIQPAVPHYRLDLFNRLAEHFGARFAVYASPTDMGVLTARPDAPGWERLLGKTLRFRTGVEWQRGILSVPIRRGDTVVVSGAPRGLGNLGTILRARLLGARVVWWGHYLSPTTRPWRHALRSLLMRGAHGLLFYTDDEVASYRATASGRKDRRVVAALNNGLNLAPIALHRLPYHAADRDRTLLFVGRLTDKAGLDLALRALARGGEAGVTLHVVGDGAGKDTLLRLARELGVNGEVVWHPATTDEAEIADVANRCRMFLYPGDVGLSLVHGMAYGLPAILHEDRSGHMPEIAAFKAGKTGVTFAPKDVGSLWKAIADSIDETERLDQMSDAALETVANDFNTARMAQRFVEAIGDINRDCGTS
ncbi:glycosyltransferase [Ruegeria sediminis]|uniref:Glycosyltransferase n=1 Tax=Ruegeria sediminis TaxID=2583820 RepID=A0ABY2X4M3_9RHOB|nr:glycosyltransferase [Ruegeria sediminis]TMV10337.1 glycosyltransferase [Ruegeria sediminis]